MCNNYCIGCDFDNSFGNFVEFRCIFEHCIVDSRQVDHKRLNWFFGIYKANKLIYNFVTVKFVYSDFGNTFFIVLSARGFYVDNRVNMLSFFVFKILFSIIGSLKIVLLIISVTKDTTSNSNHCASA